MIIQAGSASVYDRALTRLGLELTETGDGAVRMRRGESWFTLRPLPSEPDQLLIELELMDNSDFAGCRQVVGAVSDPSSPRLSRYRDRVVVSSVLHLIGGVSGVDRLAVDVLRTFDRIETVMIEYAIALEFAALTSQDAGRHPAP